MKKTIWSNPDGFSIHDILAICFSGIFLVSAVYIMIKPAIEQIEVLKVLSQPVMVILTGYFGDQIMKGYRQGKIEEKEKELECKDVLESI